MEKIRSLFLLLIVIGPLHMAEQLVTGIEEFHAIRRGLAGYYAWFDPAFADSATVILITVVWTLVSLMFYALSREGTARLVVLGLIGAFGGQEVHHVFEAIARRGYDPGLVTCIPYAIVGNLLVAAVLREFRRTRLASRGATLAPVAG